MDTRLHSKLTEPAHTDDRTPPPPAAARRAALLARVPTALLILSGACTVSVAIAVGGLLLGHGAPPLAVTVAPPALAGLCVAVWIARASSPQIPQIPQKAEGAEEAG